MRIPGNNSAAGILIPRLLCALFERYNQLFPHAVGQCLKRSNCRTAGSVFDPADVGLTYAGFFRQFLLSQVLADSGIYQGMHDFKFRTGALIPPLSRFSPCSIIYCHLEIANQKTGIISNLPTVNCVLFRICQAKAIFVYLRSTFTAYYPDPFLLAAGFSAFPKFCCHPAGPVRII